MTVESVWLHTPKVENKKENLGRQRENKQKSQQVLCGFQGDFGGVFIDLCFHAGYILNSPCTVHGDNGCLAPLLAAAEGRMLDTQHPGFSSSLQGTFLSLLAQAL